MSARTFLRAINRQPLRAVAAWALIAAACSTEGRHEGAGAKPQCAPDNGGLTLPTGFCAAVVLGESPGTLRGIAVDEFGHLYTLAVRDSGGVYVRWDANGDGVFDHSQRLTDVTGVGAQFTGDTLWVASPHAVLSAHVDKRGHALVGALDTIVVDLPRGGEHGAKPLVLGGSGSLYVAIGSESNSCQVSNRAPGSPGRAPCPELANRAGIWRFDAGRTGQRFADGERIATGMRSVVGFARHPASGELFATIHGIDDLHRAWPALYTPRDGATKPSESLVLVQRGGDYGWPTCYFDRDVGSLLQTAEYGGDGQKRCANAAAVIPLLGFTGRTGPNALLFHSGRGLPDRYRNGAFVSLHGPTTWTEFTTVGYALAFVPFANGRPAGEAEVFANGFAGPDPRRPLYRPMGLAEGPDGSLFVGETLHGRVWRIMATPAPR